MSTLTGAARAALFAPQTSAAFPWLVTLYQSDETTVVTRVTSNAEAVTLGGLTWEPFPLVVALPEDAGDGPRSVRMTLANVDRSLVPAIRGLDGPLHADVSILMVTGAGVPSVAYGPLRLRVTGVTYSAETIVAELAPEDVLSEAFPAHRFTPSSFPGLYT